MNNWRDHAPCREIGVEVFFHDDTTQVGGNHSYADARRICDPCPVRQDCLDAALTIEGDKSEQDRAGMWGGRTPKQRYRLHRQRAGRAVA
jgi:hypothetical protein